MSLPNNKLTIITDNPICANGAVENSDASYSTTVVSGGLLTLPNQSIQNNGVASGFIPSVGTINVTTNAVPTSFTITGRTIDIVVPAGSSPSGVLFKTIEPSQYTSYRTGDEGWRSQNGWFDYTPPTTPKSIAALDYTNTAFFNVLASPLVVNGVSSTTRFVDVDGGQTFSATGNKNLVVIDKLTGLMFNRLNIAGAANWNAAIDNALAYSVVVNSVTYDDWYLATKKEIENSFHLYAGINSHIDTLTSVAVMPNSSNINSATTVPSNTANHFFWELATRYLQPIAKTTGLSVLYVRNARNLITAP